jgi:glycine hydroxymethyltransferase
MRHHLQSSDPTIAFQLWRERTRQDNCLHLEIALNYLSEAVFEAQFAAATACLAWRTTPADQGDQDDPRSVVDTVQQVAARRACRLFGAEYANVLPMSGSQAGVVVQHATLRCGDAVLDVSASHGRPTLRISRVNPLGHLDPLAGCWIGDGRGHIDCAVLARQVQMVAPRLVRVTVTANWGPDDWAPLAAVAHDGDAYFAVDLGHFAGPVAAGILQSPAPHADFVSMATNGTLRGPRGGLVLAAARFEPHVERALVVGNGNLVAFAAKAVALHEAFTEPFRRYQRQMLDNVRAMSAVLAERGFATDSRESGQIVVAGVGPPGSASVVLERLAAAHVFADRYRLYRPDEDQVVDAGIGVGVAALTARGLTTGDSAYVAHVIADLLDAPQRDGIVERARDEVHELCRQFPVGQ